MMTMREQTNPRCFACAAPTGVMRICSQNPLSLSGFWEQMHMTPVGKCEINPGFAMFCWDTSQVHRLEFANIRSQVQELSIANLTWAHASFSNPCQCISWILSQTGWSDTQAGQSLCFSGARTLPWLYLLDTLSSLLGRENSRLWLKFAPKVKLRISLANLTCFKLWSKWAPKMMLLRLEGKVTSSKLWSKLQHVG